MSWSSNSSFSRLRLTRNYVWSRTNFWKRSPSTHNAANELPLLTPNPHICTCRKDNNFLAMSLISIMGTFCWHPKIGRLIFSFLFLFFSPKIDRKLSFILLFLLNWKLWYKQGTISQLYLQGWTQSTIQLRKRFVLTVFSSLSDNFQNRLRVIQNYYWW